MIVYRCGSEVDGCEEDIGTGKNQAHLEALLAIHVVDLALVLVRKDVIGLAYLLKLLLSLLSVILVLVRMPVQSQ